MIRCDSVQTMEKERKLKHKVVIISYETGKPIHSIECGTSERKAARVERGVNINIDHDKYYTMIEIRE